MSRITRRSGSLSKSRAGRLVAAGLAATVAVAGASLIGGTSAHAEPSESASPGARTATQWAEKPTVQAAGNFLDVTVGGSTLDPLLKLAFARADYDGSATQTSAQNPLDVKVLNLLDLPLTGLLQLPGLNIVHLGTVNQVAKAQPDGFSYGAAGAVLNSGAISLGGDNNAFPADATIELDPGKLLGQSALSALGSIKLSINGVSAIAQTPVGFDKGVTTDYRIADIKLELGSPLLGQLLGPVFNSLTGLLGGLTGKAAGAGQALPGECATLGADALQIAGGVVAFKPSTAQVSISLNALLQSLHLDLNELPPNTNLIGYLLNYLTDPAGLIGGVINAVTNIFGSCTSSVTSGLKNIPILGQLIDMLTGTLNTTTQTLQQITAKLAGNSGIGATIANLIKPLIAIGVNVQPAGPAGTFQTKFKQPMLPKQGMTPPAKPYTGLVRALEIDILGGALNIGLANAAAGPSFGGKEIAGTSAGPSESPEPTPSPSKSVAGVAAGPPTAIPAGQAGGGMPVAPLVLLVVGLMMAGGGAVAWKLRARTVL